MRMTKKELASICSLLIAGAAFGAVTTKVSETFESFSQGEIWHGSTTISNGTCTAPVAGLPITHNVASVTDYLVVDDFVICSNQTTASTPVMLDMMVQATVPDEELAFPEDEESSNVQIAVGVDSNNTMKVYCTPKGGSTGWYTLCNVTPDDWYRVTMVFDYENGFAQVRVNGEPKMTEYGYLTPNTSESKDGAWYKLAVNSPTQLKAVSVIGSTGLDEFLITEGTMDEIRKNAAVAGETGSISNSWFDAWGIAWNAGASYDDSGLTLAQKFEAGLNPLNGDKLALKSMAVDTTTGKATFEIPVINPPTGKKVQLVTATDSGFGTGTVKSRTDVTNSGSVSVDLPTDDNVIYYRLETANE